MNGDRCKCVHARAWAFVLAFLGSSTPATDQCEAIFIIFAQQGLSSFSVAICLLAASHTTTEVAQCVHAPFRIIYYSSSNISSQDHDISSTSKRQANTQLGVLFPCIIMMKMGGSLNGLEDKQYTDRWNMILALEDIIASDTCDIFLSRKLTPGSCVQWSW